MSDIWFIDDLIQFSATASMRGQYGGNVLLDNKDHVHTRSNRLGLPLIIRTPVSGHLAGCTVLDSTWLCGLVSALEDSHDGVSPSKQVSLDITSVAATLAARPINSQVFDGYTVNEALALLFTEYGGMTGQFFNFTLSETETLERVVVTGENLVEEARQLARAFGGDLFINRVGTLVAQDWKDNSDPIEYSIPDHMVKGVRAPSDISFGISRIKVRGRYYSNTEEPGEEGAPDVSDPAGNRTPGGQGGDEGNPVQIVICTVAPVWKRDRELKIAAPIGDGIDFKNAKIEPAAGDMTGLIIDPSATAEAEVTYTLDIGSGFPATSDPTVPEEETFTLHIGRLPEREKEPAAIKAIAIERPKEAPADMIEHIGRMFKVGLGGIEKVKIAQPKLELVPGTEVSGERFTSGEGAVGGGGGGANLLRNTESGGDRFPDEGDELRIECTRDDDDLKDEFGVRIEEVSNKYVKNSTLACALAERSFTEYKMRRRQWTVNISFIPCLDVNMVVRFRIPHTDTYVDGLLTEISLNAQMDPFDFDLVLTVESFEDLS